MRGGTYEMYVYIKSEPQLWTVDLVPNGEWIFESD